MPRVNVRNVTSRARIFTGARAETLAETLLTSQMEAASSFRDGAMRTVRYDVFERVGGETAFELVSYEETQSGRLPLLIDDLGGEMVEFAHGVSAATAAELVGLPASSVHWLENHVAEYGSLAVGNFSEDWEVRRTCDDC
jgi:hypothetical protein